MGAVESFSTGLGNPPFVMALRGSPELASAARIALEIQFYVAVLVASGGEAEADAAFRERAGSAATTWAEATSRARESMAPMTPAGAHFECYASSAHGFLAGR